MFWRTAELEDRAGDYWGLRCLSGFCAETKLFHALKDMKAAGGSQARSRKGLQAALLKKV